MKTNVLLAVDDKPDNLYIFRSLISEHLPDCKLVTATSAREGLAAALDGDFDGVLIDVQMPGIGGIDMCRMLKSNEKTAHVPVIMITAHGADAKLKAGALNAGADDFLTKPIDNIELMAKINVMLRIRRAEGELRDTNAHLEQLVAERTQALQHERNNLHGIFEAMADGVYVVNQQYDIQYVNPVFQKDFGPCEGRKCYNYFHDRTGVCPWCKSEDVWAGKTVQWEWYSSRNGKTYDLLDTPIKLADGGKGKLEIFRDITARKQAEEEMREREVFIKTVMDNLPIGLAVNSVDPNVQFEYMNDNFAKCYRTIREALASPDSFWDAVYEDPGYREEIKNRVLDDCAGGDPEQMCWADIPITRKGEETTFINATNTPLPDTQLMISTVCDVTERKRVEDALHRSEQRFREFAELLPQVVCETDRDGNLTFVNNNAFHVFGYSGEDLQAGLNILEMIAPEDRDRAVANIQRVMNDEGDSSKEYAMLKRDGATFPAMVYSIPTMSDGQVVGLKCIVIDISEQRQLEAQLRQSQKLEAVGQLAGGVAHDFNNLLTGIIGYAQLLSAKADDKSMAADLDQITALGHRAANLTRQLLAFSRRQPMEPVVMNINQLVENTSKMLKRLIGEDIDLVFTPEKNLGQIRADPGQVEQVLMNLAVNARDAMPKGGKLTIETANVTLDQDYANEHQDTEPGPYVMLGVTDNGCGMDEKTRRRIFEPFFTTKDVGQGTGLGLSTAYGIVKQHKGNICVYSEPGKGTTFKVYLARVDGEARDLMAKKEDDVLPRGSETILLVEDEESVRDIAIRQLEELGYKVYNAHLPSSAEAFFEKHGDKITLLLTDVVLPECSGRRLYERLVKKDPSLKVLYMSGYTSNAIVHRGELDPGTPFMQKPFDQETIAEKVREALDG